MCLDTQLVDIVAFCNEMKKYHEFTQSIPEYIHMLEATQRKAGRIKKGVDAATTQSTMTMLDILVVVQLEIQQFLRTNKDWEKLREYKKCEKNGRRCIKNRKTLPTSEPPPQADQMCLGERLPTPPPNWSRSQVM